MSPWGVEKEVGRQGGFEFNGWGWAQRGGKRESHFSAGDGKIKNRNY